MNLKKYQSELLSLANEFHTYCEENSIPYIMSFGTFLGAVRHKGFIPWDDDIDFSMFRSDLENFILDCQNNPKNPFILVKHERKYNLPFPEFKRKSDIDKTDAPLFDIFPIDYLPNSKNKNKRIINRSHLIYRVYFSKNCDLKSIFYKNNSHEKKILNYLKGVIKRILYRYFLDYNLLVKNTVKKLKKYQRDTFCLDGLPFTDKNRLPLKLDIFNNRSLYEFENRFFYGPTNYNEYLTNVYGDYLTPSETHLQHFSEWDIK